jgi:RimJ/RimL family protein N-acetyltransferase
MLAQPIHDGKIQLPKTQPTLKTERLILRPFDPADAPLVQILAGDKDVASTTRLIPHPYPDGLAESWIASLQGAYERGEGVSFAITLKEGALIGSIGLILSLADHHGEMGYWIGTPYWNSCSSPSTRSTWSGSTPSTWGATRPPAASWPSWG